MSKLVSVKVNLSEPQRKRLAAAYHKKEPVSVQIGPGDYDGDSTILITPTIARRMAKHKAQGVGTRIALTKNLVQANSKEGGFLGAILKFLPKLLPKLANGAATAVGQWAVEKALNKVIPAKHPMPDTQPIATAGSGLYYPGAPIHGRGGKKKSELREIPAKLEIKVRPANVEPLTNVQLEGYLSRVARKYFRGIFSHDNLPSKMNPDELAVVNLDSQTGPGTHWVGLANRKTLPFVVYYDSFGIAPSVPIARYLATSGKPIMYSSGNSQDPNSVLCGAYVAKVLRLLASKSHPIDAVNIFNTVPTESNEKMALAEYRKIAK